MSLPDFILCERSDTELVLSQAVKLKADAISNIYGKLFFIFIITSGYVFVYDNYSIKALA
ncbi:hypothetical protein HMPREF1982_02893 [Clostridiales bacterium oral taxon 876 str. F0540]|nr:hypothetical protein HMPREF1982_02893 [Clostridiales bacterium oral taxon 876 str. F0540]